jgi:putative tricarboxylic transport membrane protein
MRVIEQTFAGLWFSFGVAVCGQSLQLGLFGDFGPGPGFFPLISGVILAVSAGILFFSKSHHLGDGMSFWTSRAALIRVVTVVVLMALLILLMPSAGFLLAGCLVTPVMIKAAGGGSWLMALGVGIGAPASVYVLFVEVLNSPLPRGMLRGII